jgi:hypothetical protein
LRGSASRGREWMAAAMVRNCEPIVLHSLPIWLRIMLSIVIGRPAVDNHERCQSAVCRSDRTCQPPEPRFQKP